MALRIFMILALVATLAGCGSSVKLDNVPVEDRTAAAVGAATPAASAPRGAADASAAAATQSRVAPVAADAAGAQAAGPQNVDRIVYFDYDSFVIKPEFQALLDAHARHLRANSNRRVAIEGHTDERGGREYNLALGQKRAEAVRRALALLGVPDNQMEAVSFGEEKPADTAATEAGWAKNRRAELAYR